MKITPACIDADFAQWAFGDTWGRFLREECCPTELCRAWNSNHGNLLHVYPCGELSADIDKMVRIWKKEIGCGQVD